ATSRTVIWGGISPLTSWINGRQPSRRHLSQEILGRCQDDGNDLFIGHAVLDIGQPVVQISRARRAAKVRLVNAVYDIPTILIAAQQNRRDLCPRYLSLVQLVQEVLSAGVGARPAE